jgi:hypothetical protein
LPPQLHIPEEQVRFELQVVPQQTWFIAPQFWQTPDTHCVPGPHPGLQFPLLPPAPPLPVAPAAPPVPVEPAVPPPAPPVLALPPVPVPVPPVPGPDPPVPVPLPPVPVVPASGVTTGTSFVPAANCEGRAQTFELVQTCGETQSTLV